MLTQTAIARGLHKSCKSKQAATSKKEYQEQQEIARLLDAAKKEFGAILENVDDLKKIQAQYDVLKKAAAKK